MQQHLSRGSGLGNFSDTSLFHSIEEDMYYGQHESMSHFDASPEFLQYNREDLYNVLCSIICNLFTSWSLVFISCSCFMLFWRCVY